MNTVKSLYNVNPNIAGWEENLDLVKSNNKKQTKQNNKTKAKWKFQWGFYCTALYTRVRYVNKILCLKNKEM